MLIYVFAVILTQLEWWTREEVGMRCIDMWIHTALIILSTLVSWFIYRYVVGCLPGITVTVLR